MCATFTAYLHNKHNRMPYLFAYINTVGSEWVEQALESKWTECDEQRSGEKRLCWVCFCTKTKCTVHWIVRFVIMWTADMLVFVFMCVSVWMAKFRWSAVEFCQMANATMLIRIKWNATFMLSQYISCQISSVNNGTNRKNSKHKNHHRTFRLCIILAFLLFVSFVWINKSHCYVTINCFWPFAFIPFEWNENSTCWPLTLA